LFKFQKSINQPSVAGVNAGRRVQGARDEVAQGFEFWNSEFIRKLLANLNNQTAPWFEFWNLFLTPKNPAICPMMHCMCRKFQKIHTDVKHSFYLYAQISKTCRSAG
jgi:hypothetical protein